MSKHKKMRRVSLKEKRRFVCGLSEADLEEIGARAGLDPETLESVLDDPQAAEDIRLDPNKVTQAQLEQIALLDPGRVETVLKGRPYYSIEELEAATALPRTVLDDLFVILPLRFQDRLADKEVALVPVPGRYIVPPRDEFEAEDPAETTGYMEIFPATEDFNFRVVESSSFEEEQAPHNMKAGFDGAVHPVLRDAQGFERYLVPGSLDLWFKPETSEDRRLSIIKELGLQLTDAVPQVGYYRVKLSAIPEDRDVTRAVLALIDRAQEFDEISFAELDQVGFEDFGPEDWVPAGDDDFEAADRFWNHEAIDLAGAHALHKGSPEAIIFTIDSGCWMNHEDLASAFRSDWQALDLNFDLGVPEGHMSPDERVKSHGTKVAGVIGGQGRDDVAQTQGIAPNCRILPVKISGKSVTPAYGLRAAAIRQALTYLKPGQRGVLNLSWRTNGEHIGIREALVEAQSKGVAIVASAGNYAPGASQGPDEIHYPSAHTYLYPNLTALCSVAATGFGDRKASYSYYGSQSITFSAPGGEKGGAGVGIYTTSTPEKRVYTRGTSFAAPHVVGLIALLFSAKPDLSAAEAIQIIKDTADPIDDVNPAYAGMLGEGRINARAALEWVAPLGNGTHDITATAGPHGTIAPAGEVTVNHGADQTFTITPDPGYRVTEVLVDGSSVGPVTTHSFENVTAPHTIEAQFAEEDGGEEPPIEPSGLLNINQATAEELITLPFIGPWLAERIIEYREAHGPFNNIWELSLTGMSPWAISQLEPLITV